eukprot:sb/3467248/
MSLRREGLPPGRVRKTRARLPTITPLPARPQEPDPSPRAAATSPNPPENDCYSLPSCGVLASDKERRDTGEVVVYENYRCMCCMATFHTIEPFRRHVYKHFARRAQVRLEKHIVVDREDEEEVDVGEKEDAGEKEDMLEFILHSPSSETPLLSAHHERIREGPIFTCPINTIQERERDLDFLIDSIKSRVTESEFQSILQKGSVNFNFLLDTAINLCTQPTKRKQTKPKSTASSSSSQIQDTSSSSPTGVDEIFAELDVPRLVCWMCPDNICFMTDDAFARHLMLAHDMAGNDAEIMGLVHGL